jgi:large subunit ribosomal protein L6
MSRIGKKPIEIPAGVTVTLNDNTVTVKGPKGELTRTFNPDITINVEEKVNIPGPAGGDEDQDLYVLNGLDVQGRSSWKQPQHYSCFAT